MKKALTLLAILFLIFACMSNSSAQVDYNDPKVRNPKNDPDVEKGWQRAQEQIQREKEADKQQQNDAQPHTEKQFDKQQRGDDDYTIKKTHDQPSGH